MSVGFPKAAAKVKDGKVWVRVKCSGTVASRCVGTLTLKLAGHVHKAAYSVKRGKRAWVKIALGDDLALAGEGAATAVVSSSTKQPDSGPTTTRRKLRLE